jgi:hypothetical protein
MARRRASCGDYHYGLWPMGYGRYVWYGVVWCPSYPLDRNRCDQVVAAGSGAS